jgi:hypothetical protein
MATKTKPERKVNLAGTPANGLLTITCGAEQTLYRIEAVAVCDFGRGFKLTKRVWDRESFAYMDGDEYFVNLGGGRYNSDECECLGHLRWGHKTVCRHVAALRALEAAGRLPASPAPAPEWTPDPIDEADLV